MIRSLADFQATRRAVVAGLEHGRAAAGPRAVTAGDVVRIREPMPDENPSQRYAVAEMRGDRALVVALDTGMSIAPQTVFLLADLERIA